MNQAMHATRTILIFTAAYIAFNIPNFINYLLMTISSWSTCENDCYLVMYGNYPFLIWFSWNFTYIMCLALNSTVNPIIYYWRMKPIKTFVNSSVRRTSKRISDVMFNGNATHDDPGEFDCNTIRNPDVSDGSISTTRREENNSTELKNEAL